MSETTLHALLLEDRAKRPALLSDCERLIDSEVKAKGGISGVAIKGAYKVVCKIKPGMIREALDSLVDPFVETLEPLFKEHLEGGGEPKAFDAFLGKNASRAADALLGVTDGKAQRAKNKTLKSAYDKLRPQAKKHVVEAVPGAGRVFVKHI
jgi:hypothetical protein